MTMDRSLCPVCAWRGDCKKKFKPGAGINCADFTRDLSIKDEGLEKSADEEKKGEGSKKSKSGLWPL